MNETGISLENCFHRECLDVHVGLHQGGKVGRDATDARLFAKVWRFIWYKDSEPKLSLTREHQVEHEAYVVLLAGRTGARVPDLVAAGLAGWRDDALHLVRNPAGVRLADVEPERQTDAALDDPWANQGGGSKASAAASSGNSTSATASPARPPE